MPSPYSLAESRDCAQKDLPGETVACRQGRAAVRMKARGLSILEDLVCSDVSNLFSIRIPSLFFKICHISIQRMAEGRSPPPKNGKMWEF